jgi:hypothetical protein
MANPFMGSDSLAKLATPELATARGSHAQGRKIDEWDCVVPPEWPD